MEKRTAKQRDRPAPGRLGRRLRAFLRLWLADMLMTAGAAAVTVGAALIYPPAGWICGGALAIAGGVLAARGEGGNGA